MSLVTETEENRYVFESRITWIVNAMILGTNVNEEYNLKMVDYWKPGIEGMRGSCYHFEVLGRRREEEVWRKFDGGNFRLSDCWVAKGFLTMEMYDGEVENLGELVDFVGGEGGDT